VPQSFRPAFNWQVREVVLMGRARQVNLFAQPAVEDERRVEEAYASWASPTSRTARFVRSPAASSSWC
jgi:iron complex transport system ATP-binding protein